MAQKRSKIPTKQTTNKRSHKIDPLTSTSPRLRKTDLRDELLILVVVTTLAKRLLPFLLLIMTLVLTSATKVLPVTSPVVTVSAFIGLTEG